MQHIRLWAANSGVFRVGGSVADSSLLLSCKDYYNVYLTH